MNDKMTIQKELFIQALLAGKPQAEAYRFAFPNEAKRLNKRTIDNKACMLAKRPEVQYRMEELKEQVRKETEVTLQQFVLDLQKIALAQVDTFGLKTSDKLRAMELLAKVLGFDQSAAGPDYEDTSQIDQQVMSYKGPQKNEIPED